METNEKPINNELKELLLVLCRTDKDRENLHFTYNAITPAKTKTYEPVSYPLLIEQVYNKIIASSLQITEVHSKCFISKKTKNVIQMEITFVITNYSNRDFRMSLSVASSHDKSFAIKYITKGIVRVCTNGMITVSNIEESRKHTKNLWQEIDSKLDNAIKTLPSSFKGTVKDIRLMRNTIFTERTALEYLGFLITNGVITRQKEIAYYTEQHRRNIGILPEEKRNFKGLSLWNYYNYVTQSFKSIKDLNESIEKHSNLHGLTQTFINLIK